MNQELMPCKCGNSIIDQKKTGSLTSYQCPACGISGPAMATPHIARVAWNDIQERLRGWDGGRVKPEEEFWLVWNLKARNPRHQHSTKDSAIEEAKRLATQNPGQAFYVVHATSVARSNEVAVTALAESIPF